MASRIGDSLLRCLDDVRRTRQVRIADSEADDVEASGALLGDAAVDFREQVGRKALDATRGADG